MLELGMIAAGFVEGEVYRSRRSTRVSDDWLLEVDLVSALSQSRQNFLYAIDVQERLKESKTYRINTS